MPPGVDPHGRASSSPSAAEGQPRCAAEDRATRAPVGRNAAAGSLQSHRALRATLAVPGSYRGPRDSHVGWRLQALRSQADRNGNILGAHCSRQRASRVSLAGGNMLHWAVIFFIIAIIAAVLGFSGIAAGAASIAKILFIIFLVIAIVTFFAGRGRVPPA